MNKLLTSLLIAASISLSACERHDADTQISGDGEPIAETAESTAPAVTAPPSGFDYPKTRKVEHIDQYGEISLNDDYRWLEELDGEDTREWIESQNAVTFGYLDTLGARDKIKQRLTELWNYERFGIPFKKGDRYFFRRNDGLQNQSVIYTMNSLDAEPTVLMDPNQLSADGTTSVSTTAVSPDGKLMAYSTSEGGSDWRDWYVLDIDTGKTLDDHVEWSKFSGASWAADSSGFYYSRYDAPTGEDELKAVNYYHKLYFHKIGTPQSEDVLVYERPDEKEWGFGGQVSDDGRYLLITVWQGTDERTRFFYRDLRQTGSEVVELVSKLDAAYNFIGNDGSTFFFHTDKDANNYRVVSIDVNASDPEFKELIPEATDALRAASYLDDKFVLTYLKDASSEVRIFDRNGSAKSTVRLPGIGTVGGFGGDEKDTETFYAFTSYTSPTTIYRYDLTTDKSELFRAPQVDFDPDDYLVKQVRYTSKDGTVAPMFIVHKKDTILDGNNPTWLYGYGGFNIPITPNFRVPELAWIEMGGVFAVATLRGGGEYGKDWHQAGTKTQKQNVFDDFIAAAEWLIENKYTNADKLAIHGRSNGGLLVGATMLQRPDLFAVALPRVGVLDMLRFNKFTIGWAWESDYGSPQDPEEFAALRAYSPLHNVKPGVEYPATLITTGDHDDRVFPAHSFKFAAALQAGHQGDNPVMIRIDTKAGHGAGKSVAMQIQEEADQLAFVADNLEMEL